MSTEFIGSSRPPTQEELEYMKADLIEAVHTGNTDAAQALVARLSQLQLPLNISVAKAFDASRSNETVFSVNVHVEDKESRNFDIDLLVQPSDDIADLKRKVWLEYKFPIKSQRWIIGKRIADDTVTLRQCGVTGNGHTLFLYIIWDTGNDKAPYAGQSRNNSNRVGSLSAQESCDYSVIFSSQSQRPLSDNISYDGPVFNTDGLLADGPSPCQTPNTVSGNGPNLLPPFPSRMPEQNQETFDSEETLVVATPLLRDNKQSVQLAENQITEPTPGWSCPVCTFHNLPTRPGCLMCATDRPADYKVPDNYQMTDEEVAMLAHQEELERLTRQPLPDQSSPRLSQPSASSAVFTSLDVLGSGVDKNSALWRYFKGNDNTSTSTSSPSRRRLPSDGNTAGQYRNDSSYEFLRDNLSESDYDDDDFDDCDDDDDDDVKDGGS